MIDYGAPVRVFKNLKHGCYSIMQNGAVRASARQVRLHDVEFRIRESGRQRMLREQRRNVHAFVVGMLVDFVHPDEDRELGELSGRVAGYFPYEFPTFVDRATHTPVRFAAMVQLDERGVTYFDDDWTSKGLDRAA